MPIRSLDGLPFYAKVVSLYDLSMPEHEESKQQCSNQNGGVA